MNVPANFVHSIFPTYARSHAYVAEERSSVASIVGVIRGGHTSEEKSQLVQALWKMFQNKTGISDRDLSVALQEVPASQAMENGRSCRKLGTRNMVEHLHKVGGQAAI
jgi:phenylpyruvate tautomerase PptA (4-oxalocrotonate tautomerase family)